MRIEGFKLIDMGLRLFILLFRDGGYMCAGEDGTEDGTHEGSP